MRYCRLGSIVLAAMALASVQTAEARTVVAGKGSRGDFFVMDECGPGFVMAGVEARAGDWLNAVRVLCLMVQPDGKGGGRTFRMDLRGPDIGMPVEQSCPLGAMPTGAKAMYTDEKFRMVYSITLTCSPSGQAQVAGARYPEDDGYVLDHWMSCQSGEFMTGLAINGGRHINNIGIICDRLEPHPSTRPAAPPEPPKRLISSKGKAAGTAPSNRVGQFDLPFESESNLGGKFDLTFKVVGMYKNPSRFHVTGTITNTDIGPQYNGTFDGTMPMSDTRTVTLTYTQPAANAQGTVVFRFSEDGETFTGEGMHMGHTPFQWTGRRKRGAN